MGAQLSGRVCSHLFVDMMAVNINVQPGAAVKNNDEIDSLVKPTSGWNLCFLTCWLTNVLHIQPSTQESAA